MSTVLTVAAVVAFAFGALFGFDVVVKGGIEEVAGCASAGVACLVAAKLP